MEVQRIVALLVEDRVEVERADLVGHQRGHHGARARADVQVELVGAEIGQGLVERGEGAHLVHAAHDPAAREHQRPLRRRRRGIRGEGRSA